MSDSRIGPVIKIDEYLMDTAWGDIWKVTILGDKKSNGKLYAEAHIKGVSKMNMEQMPGG
jgi:hypothetical protein